MQRNVVYRVEYQPIQGSTLYPLYMLEHIYPDIFEHAIARYQHRQHILNLRIPTLNNCRWNDVIHLSAVHPAIIRQELMRASGDEYSHLSYYEIPVSQLNTSELTVFLPKPDFQQWDGTFVEYREVDLGTYAEFPEINRQWFNHQVAQGSRITFWWAYIPHILYRGAIDVSQLPFLSTES